MRLSDSLAIDSSSAIDTPAKRSRRQTKRKRVETRTKPGIMRKRHIPSYNLLDETTLAKIEAHADWILSSIGVEFRDDEVALEAFHNAGIKIDGCRVIFEADQARELCSWAPSRFFLHSRNPDHTIELGGDQIVLMPGYGSPFVTDLASGRRYATLADFKNFVSLTYQTPYLHHSGGTVVEPVDIPVNKRHLDMVLAHLSLSDKPFMGSVTSESRAKDSVEMAGIVFGHEFMSSNAVMQANINVNSPLVYDGTMTKALRQYAYAKQCVCVSPAIFGGAMGPVTPAAIAAQTLAEAMAGIALVQLINPGCPVVLGSFHSTMNLRTGSLTFGTPEANLATMILAQLGRRLGIPVRSGGGQITAANAADGQAMQDSANAMWATLISGAHQVWHAAGWLEGGLTMSYEKFILDLDNCGSMLRFLQGISANDEDLPRDSYLEAGPGQNFLSTSHTIQNYATANYESLLPDAGPYETWKEQGSMPADQRAHAIWKEMLNNYRPPELPKNTKQKLEDFVVARKSEMPDEWY